MNWTRLKYVEKISTKIFGFQCAPKLSLGCCLPSFYYYYYCRTYMILCVWNGMYSSYYYYY
jgi:hypothetical protein